MRNDPRIDGPYDVPDYVLESGVPCPVCEQIFEVGEQVGWVLLGYGSGPADQSMLQSIVVHWSCASIRPTADA